MPYWFWNRKLPLFKNLKWLFGECLSQSSFVNMQLLSESSSEQKDGKLLILKLLFLLRNAKVISPKCELRYDLSLYSVWYKLCSLIWMFYRIPANPGSVADCFLPGCSYIRLWLCFLRYFCWRRDSGLGSSVHVWGGKTYWEGWPRGDWE